jgi:hypothetical protein
VIEADPKSEGVTQKYRREISCENRKSIENAPSVFPIGNTEEVRLAVSSLFDKP